MAERQSRSFMRTAWCTAAIDWLALHHVGDDVELRRRARLVVAFGWTLISLAAVYATIFFAMNSPIGSAVLGAGAGMGIAALTVMRRTGSCFIVGNLLTAAFFVALTGLACRLGGHGAHSLAWYAGVPIVALSTAGRRSALTWLVVTTASFAEIYLLHLGGYSFPNDLTPGQYDLLGFFSWVGLTVLLLSLTLVYETAMSQTLAELRSAEHRLLRERNFSDSAIASLPGMFYLFDDQGRYLRWNENLEHVSGFSPEELRKMNPLDFFRGQDREVILHRIEEGFSTGQTVTEACFITKDGTAIPYLFSGRRLLIDGRPHLVGMGIDIADRKQTEAALAAARDRAEAATRAKSEFLANMSHEIRTPMTAILGFSEILAASITDPDQHDSVKTIQRNGEYLLGIINDILDLSKIEAGKMEIERVQCCPRELLDELVSLMRVRANAKSLPLEVEYDGPIPRSIQSDPKRLRQILINLMGNAVKFTETGKVRLVARLLDPQCEDPKMQFDVIDSGIGMTDAQISELFKPFGQLDASTTRKHGGTGLGLTISKRLSRELGGDIVVKSAAGEGSTFTVTVTTGPLDGVELLAGPTVAQSTAAHVSKPSASDASLKCRVLIAEDGPDNQRLLSLFLKKAGAEVSIAENGQIAHDAALAARDAGTPFDVILMDMQMPVMDGYSATGKLRAAGYAGPIIALTAHAMSADRDRCLDAGCDDYMTKPVNRKNLVALVGNYASRSMRSFSNSS
ncbi:MAG: response regulator [Rhodopirellula sp.]|nr:response regulator [Rhodopirellula sp.]